MKLIDLKDIVQDYVNLIIEPETLPNRFETDEEFKDMYDTYGDYEVVCMRSTIEDVWDMGNYDSALEIKVAEKNRNHCENCFNYNIGDGYDDIQVCQECEHYSR